MVDAKCSQTWFHTILFLLSYIPFTLGTTLTFPTQTSIANDVADPLGFTPKPTSMPTFGELELFKREIDDGVCGYISGFKANPLTCNNGNLCGFNTLIGAAGCCTNTFFGTNGVKSYTGCRMYTSCVDYTNSAYCGASCQANTLVKKCGVGAPYCLAYYYTDVRMSLLDCFTANVFDRSIGLQPIGGLTETSSVFVGSIDAAGSASASIFSAVTDSTTASIGNNRLIGPDSSLSPVTTTVSGQTVTVTPYITTVSGSEVTVTSLPQITSSGDNSSTAHSSDPDSSRATSSGKGGLIGGIVGAVVGVLAIVAGLVLFCLRRRRTKQKNEKLSQFEESSQSTPPPTVSAGSNMLNGHPPELPNNDRMSSLPPPAAKIPEPTVAEVPADSAPQYQAQSPGPTSPVSSVSGPGSSHGEGLNSAISNMSPPLPTSTSLAPQQAQAHEMYAQQPTNHSPMINTPSYQVYNPQVHEAMSQPIYQAYSSSRPTSTQLPYAIGIAQPYPAAYPVQQPVQPYQAFAPPQQASPNQATVHEAPGQMSYRAGPSSTWSGPHEMP